MNIHVGSVIKHYKTKMKVDAPAMSGRIMRQLEHAE